MHPNPTFRSKDHVRDLAFARTRGFGILAVAGEGAPLLSHVPFLVSDEGMTVDLHLVRSNPIVRALSEPRPARIAASGPDGYVSPDWYGLEDQVPTWNYVAVHLTGTLERLPDDEMRPMLDRQSAAYEERLAPKPPWRVEKMSDDALARLLRMIVPCRMRIDAVDATWKLAQNKPEAARLGAAEDVPGGIGLELDALAALMREPPDL